MSQGRPIKYNREEIRKIIDDWWRENKTPPSLRNLMDRTGITSTSVMHYVLHQIPGIRFSEEGHPIPKWVDQAIERREA